MERHDRRNITLYATGESIWGFQWGMVASATVLTVLLREYGAGDVMIGSIMGIETGLLMLPQIIGLYIFSSIRKRKRQLIMWHLFTMAPLIAAMGVVVLLVGEGPSVFGRWGLLAAFALRMASMGIIVGVWLDWLAHIFDESVRGRAMGTAMFASAGMGALGSLLAGWLIDRFPGHVVYGVLFISAAVIACFSIVIFIFVDDRADRIPDVSMPRDPRTLLARFRESFADRNFRAFFIGRIIAALGFCMVPFIAIHYGSADGGGLTGGTIVACGAAITIGTALSNIVLGRIGDRHGHRIGIIVGAAAQVVSLSIALTVPGQFGCITAYFFAGVCFGVVLLCHTNMLFETCPHDHRLAHITASSILFSVPVIAAPILAGVVARQWGVRILFAVCLCFSAAAVAWFTLMVKEPRLLRVYVHKGAVWERPGN